MSPLLSLLLPSLHPPSLLFIPSFIPFSLPHTLTIHHSLPYLSADESQFEKDLLDIARTTLSSKLLNVEKDHFARSVCL